MIAAIPYTTFPTVDLGPLNLRTFGLMVALGVLLGSWIAAAYAERYGVSRDETYRVATYMVLAGIIGSRLTWAATHTDQIENPIDVIAIWEGGIQFSGGFVAALIVGLPFFRRWTRLQRWHVLDGYALGLSLGLAIGRIGCYSVGEHFGRTSDFFLASRYDGGDVREPSLGDTPLVPGTTFHNTSLYELLFLLVLFVPLASVVVLRRRRGADLPAAAITGTFVLYYGVARWLTDSLRVNDERVAGMTGAQWMCLAMIPAGLWILLKVRPSLAAAASAEAEAGEAEPAVAPDKLAAPDEEAAATGVDEEAAATGADEVPAATGADEEAAATGADERAEQPEPDAGEDVPTAGADGATVAGSSDDDGATVPPTER
ncbi:MAG TPA: prolipoprotein diacylglyceryl transferase family protein [Acidimicrobiales bacterium]|nr:prolipoprotein diacylglyceryl transferase family protein [Acidimicrobiales bacterium]